MQTFKQQTRLFKSALLAGGIYANQHLFNRENGCKSVHIEGGLCTLRKQISQKKPHLRGAAVFFASKKGLLHHALGRNMVMVHDSIFVIDHLAVQFINQVINGRIEVLVRTFCK